MFRFFDIGTSFLNDLHFETPGGRSGGGNLNIQNIQEPTGGNPEDLELLNEEEVGDPDNPESQTRRRDRQVNQGDTGDDEDEESNQGDNEEEDEEGEGGGKKKKSKSKQEGDEDEQENEEGEIDLTDEEERDEVEEENEEAQAKPLFTRLKDIDKDIFKKIPELRTVVGQHKQYTDMFGTVQEAASAYENNQTFNEMEADLLDGNVQPLFESFRRNAPEALPRIAKNVLEHLWKTDKDAHAIAVRPVLIDLVHKFAAEGNLHNNDHIKNAAKWLSKFLFNDSTPPQASQGPTEEEKRLQKQLDDERQTNYTNGLKRVNQVCVGRLENEILKVVDSKGNLPERTRKAIIDDVYTSINEEIKKDAGYMARMKRLTDSAQRSKFGRGEDASIVNAFMARVRNLVRPTARKIMEEWNVDSDNDNGNSDNQSGNRNRSGNTGNRGQNNTRNTGNNRQSQSGGGNRNRVATGGNRDSSSRARSDRLQYDPSDVNWDKTPNEMLLGGSYIRKKDGKRIRFRKQYE